MVEDRHTLVVQMIIAEDFESYLKEVYTVKRFGYKPPLTFGMESETARSIIHIFGTNGTQYFRGTLFGFEERPSVEWLSSFRLVPIE